MNLYTNKRWIITISALSLLIIFCILWILFFQYDLLNFDWIVAHNGNLWKGKVSDENIEWLKSHYPAYTQDIDQYLNQYIVIVNTGKIIFNINILWILIGCFLFTLFISFILKITNVCNWEIFTFNFCSLFAFTVFVFSDLIPVWNVNQNFLRMIVIFFITILSTLIIFFILNSFFNKLILKNNFSNEYANNILAEENELLISDEIIVKETKSNEKEYIED